MKRLNLFLITNILIIPAMIYLQRDMHLRFFLLILFWLGYMALYGMRHREEFNGAKPFHIAATVFLVIAFLAVPAKQGFWISATALLLFNSSMLLSTDPRLKEE